MSRNDLRVGWCPGALRPMQARDGLIVRLRPTGGILAAATARAVADLAERHGSGAIELTARANLQLRGIRATEWPALIDALRGLDLLDADPGGEAVRNVVASPLAGLGPGLDIRPVVAALEHRLAGDAALHALPAKFAWLVDDGGEPSLAGVAADIRFAWDGERFRVALGGTAAQAWQAGTCSAAELPDRAAALGSATIAARARLGEDAPRRLRALLPALSGTGRAPFGAEAPPRPAPPAPAPTLIGLRRFGAILALGLGLPFGRSDAAMLRAAADAADAADAWGGELRLTPWRALLLPRGRAMSSPPCNGDGRHDAFLARLAATGFITDAADPRLRVATCVGAAGCHRGTVPTLADAAALAPLLPADLALHVSGCVKGCAHPAAAAVTLVGRDGAYDLVHHGRTRDEPVHRGLSLMQAAAMLTEMAA